VPVTNVSLVDLTVRLESPVASKEELMNAFRTASGGQLAGVLRVSDEKLVSSDYLSSTESSIIDADASVMLDDKTAKIVAWYDNEYGFASRMCDLVVYMRAISIKNRAGDNGI
jgi:glyceraldehyde 3-phosphate dehydrogenase